VEIFPHLPLAIMLYVQLLDSTFSICIQNNLHQAKRSDPIDDDSKKGESDLQTTFQLTSILASVPIKNQTPVLSQTA